MYSINGFYFFMNIHGVRRMYENTVIRVLKRIFRPKRMEIIAGWAKLLNKNIICAPYQILIR
jgi:hypothetical protein